MKENDNPILNNPYLEPKYHYNVDANGNLDYNSVLEGRRPYMANIRITPNRSGSTTIFNAEDSHPSLSLMNPVGELQYV